MWRLLGWNQIVVEFLLVNMKVKKSLLLIDINFGEKIEEETIKNFEKKNYEN